MSRTFACLLLVAAPLLAKPFLLIGGGPALTWLNSKTRDEVQGWPRFGYNLTAQLELPLGPELFLVIGPSLESKGEKYELLAPDYNENWDDGKISLTYLQVPMLLKFSSKGPGTTVAGLIGPEVGFLLAKRLELNGSRVHDPDFSRWTSPDIGVGWGVQVDFPKANQDAPAFFVRAGGFYGFVDGADGFDNPFWKYREYDSRNVGMKVTAGIRFGEWSTTLRETAPAARPAAVPAAPAAPVLPAAPVAEPAPPARKAVPAEVLEK